MSGQPSDSSSAAARQAHPATTPAAASAPASATSPILTQVAAASRPAPAARAATAQDTSRDSLADDFVDSLRDLASDSSAVVTTPVDSAAVHTEAVTLFGRPTDGTVAATYDIQVQRYASQERVQYWLDYFSTRAANHFAVYLKRAGRYDSMIRTRLAAAGLPQDLIFLAMIESGFNPAARSRAGAVGMWQFMPSTARRYGLTVDAWVDERRDPFLSTDAAIRMLSELNDRFGSLYLAAAAYNSGPGKIQAGLARYDFGELNGDDAYFAMSEGTFLHRETRDYVPKLIAAALISKDPQQYGFSEDDVWRPMSYDSVPVRFAVGLDVVARLADTSRTAIEDLNPMFYRGVTPPDREVWVRVPVGTTAQVGARLATLPPSERITILIHYVARGETLSRIARQYGVTTEDLRMANHLRGSYLRVGQRLMVPTALLHERSASRARAGSRVREVRRSSPAPRTRAAAAPMVTRHVHIVRSGENPWTIAQRFGVSVDALLTANGLTHRSVLHAGQAIRIP